MIMDAQTRNRPSLEVRTDYGDGVVDGLPRTAFRTHRSPLPSPTPLTAKPLPHSLQPLTPRYDIGMRQHERAMVESLDSRDRQGSFGDGRTLGRSLSPVAEQFMAARVGNLAMDSRVNTTPTNSRHPSEVRSSRSIVDETRSMLLSGMNVSQAVDLGTVANRRPSTTGDMAQKNRRKSLALVPVESLQEWGHVYFNNPTKAHVLVAPSALRRHSGGGQADGIEGGRLAIRARIRPRGKDRKAFILARNFDLEQLRTTLPATPTTPSSSRRQSGTPLSPVDMPYSARTPTTPLTPLAPGLASERRRSSAGAAAARFSAHQLRIGAKEMPVREFSPASPCPDPTPTPTLAL